MVLIDAAKGCAIEPPDLSKCHADYVVSFYKLFGYPTGCGALIVRNEAANLLKKYFSEGTVASSIADIDFVKRIDGIEESSVSFLSIAALKHGFKTLNTLTMPAIFRHTTSLATYARTKLFVLRHENGTRVCTLYGNYKSKALFDELGPTVSFNLKRPDESWFGYREVEKLASLSGIQLRTGCFCNPGACAKYLGLFHLDLLSNIEAGHVCGENHDIVHGKPTGAVRVSFGYMSTFEDAKKFLDFIKGSFLSTLTLSENVYISGAKPNSFSSEGLTHDWEWLLKGLDGEIFTQEKILEMCFISTNIDLKLGILYVESPRCKTKLQIKLETGSYTGTDELSVYVQRYEVYGYGTEVNTWFSEAVGRPCVLVNVPAQRTTTA